MTPEMLALSAAALLGLWLTAVGGTVGVRAVVGLVQDHGSAILLRWWLEAAALAALVAAVGAALAVWAANQVGVLP